MFAEISSSTPLWPVYEEKESPTTPDVQEGTFFANIHAEDFEEAETAVDNNVDVGITDVVIANKSVIDNESGYEHPSPPLRSSKGEIVQIILL